ncbi:MAG: hypothetical protein AAGI07_07165 [Bacteroidota bacterium]
MKNNIRLFVIVASILFSFAAIAQTTKTVHLDQTPGEFAKKELTLKAGETYVFEVANKGIDHKVGFVIAPKDKLDQKHHVKNAYLSTTISDGEVASSKEVVLEKGEYVYFCPLNPTPKYALKVE